jgi:hypothetical protein
LADLRRRIVLTYRYLGWRELSWRVLTFPLRFTPLRRCTRRRGALRHELELARSWYRRHGQPVTVVIPSYRDAEEVTKLQAICVVCGDLACRNQRLVDGRPARWDMPVVMVGGSESYEARCRRCFRVPRHDEDQVALL